MRDHVARVALTLALVSAAHIHTVATPALASGDDPPPLVVPDKFDTQGSVNASSTLAGYDNPPGPGRSGQPPCPSPAPPPPPPDPDDPNAEVEEVEERESENFVAPAGKLMDVEENVVNSEDGEPIRTVVVPQDGGRLDGAYAFETYIDHTFVVEYVQYSAGCRTPSGAADTSTVRRYWVQRPTDESVLADLLVDLCALLESPELTWPDKDPTSDGST